MVFCIDVVYNGDMISYRPSRFTAGLIIIARLCPSFWCHSREIPLHGRVSPAAAAISSLKPHVNKTVIERALHLPVSSYLHFHNMFKSCLNAYSLLSVFWCVCVCVCVRLLNRSYNWNKDSWPYYSKLQTLLMLESLVSLSWTFALIYSVKANLKAKSICCVMWASFHLRTSALVLPHFDSLQRWFRFYSVAVLLPPIGAYMIL